MKTPDPKKRPEPADEEVQIAKEFKTVLVGCAVAALALVIFGLVIWLCVPR